MKNVYALFTKLNGKEIFSFYTEDAKKAVAWRMQDPLNRGIHIEKVCADAEVTETTITEVEHL